MQRITSSDSMFHDGDPTTGVLGTFLAAVWHNAVQEEIAGFIEKAGIVLDPSDNGQLLKAFIAYQFRINVLTDTGAVNAYAVENNTPLTADTWTNGVVQRFVVAHTNNGPSTFSPDGLPPIPIYGLGLDALQGNEMLAGGTATLMKQTMPSVNGGDPFALLIWCSGGALQVPNATQPQHAVPASQVQTGALTSAVAGGTANALTATLPLNGSGLSNNQKITLTAAAVNTGAATLALTMGSTVLPAYPIVKGDDQPLAPGDIPGVGYPIDLDWSVSFGAFVMQNPATGISPAVASLSVSAAANALTGTLNAPTTLSFRNPTLSSGVPVSASMPANLSLTVPSGATLGTTNGAQSRLVWLVAYNGGNPVLCVVNLSGGLNLDESTLISPTTISATAIAANIIYSESAVTANSPFRVVGFCDITEAVAGTWTSGPTTVQGIGGEAGVGLVSLPRALISNFMVYQSAAQTVSSGSTATVIQYQSKVFDDLSEFNAATNAFVAKNSGTYVFAAASHGGGGTSNRILELWVNGSVRVRLQETPNVSSTPCGYALCGGSGPVELNAGDMVQVYITYQAPTTDTMVQGQPYTYFGGWRVK